MKRSFFCLLALLLAAGGAFAQGKLLENKTVKSAILGRAVRYSIYLPPGYDRSEHAYPVVYLLHGFTDDNIAWTQFAGIDRLADEAIASGKIPPMIIVMPNGDSSWYVNSFDGKEKYNDFFVKEFIPSIETAYRIRATKQFRGIAGLSMGGYGTLYNLIAHPDLFAAGAALSAGVFTDDEIVKMPQENWENVLGRVYGRGLTGDARLNGVYKTESILGLVASKSAEELSQVHYWIDCGDRDFLTKGNCMLHIALTEKKVPHEFRVRSGQHQWLYWRTGIVDGLAYIGRSFLQDAY